MLWLDYELQILGIELRSHLHFWIFFFLFHKIWITSQKNSEFWKAKHCLQNKEEEKKQVFTVPIEAEKDILVATDQNRSLLLLAQQKKKILEWKKVLEQKFQVQIGANYFRSQQARR